jgi:23S rRNA pseudouridine2605 synthase
MPERVQKILSACGLASRRQAEQMIQAGRVTVNGAVAQLGDQAVLGRDIIALDGAELAPLAEKTYLMLHKPRGYVTTMRDEKGRKTVRDLVKDCPARVYPVGRLDLDSEGLLLMTDDGALAHCLMHPSHQVEKEYLVWVRGDVERALPALRRPMVLDGEKLAPARVFMKKQGETSLLSITIHQGKNRQVRRMCALAGLHVTRLKRVSIGTLRLKQLEKGTWRTLTAEEIDYLQQLGKKNEGREKF